MDIDSLTKLYSQPGPSRESLSDEDPPTPRGISSSSDESEQSPQFQVRTMKSKQQSSSPEEELPRRSLRRRSQQSTTSLNLDDDDDDTLAPTNDFDEEFGDGMPFQHVEEEEDQDEALAAIMPTLARNGLRHLRIDQTIGVILCIECKAAVAASTVFNHLNTIHKAKVSNDDQTLISTWYSAEDEKLADETDQCPQIPRGGAPFHGLEIFDKGYACIACSFCAIKLGTFTKHWSMVHRKITTPAKQSYRDAAIQTFFKNPPCYFVVNRSLINTIPGSAYAKYIMQYTPHIDAISNIGLEADSSKEVPPLLQVTQWHTHLEGFIGPREKNQLLRSIVQSPRGKKAEENPLGDELRSTILQYMSSIKKKAQSVDLRVRQLLMQCPL